ncbi:MAG: hypothetical protein HOP02_08210 [Methylococcaceae bacterium]|nr:hypothetical protein [Methylococcaceae bacterium]
MNIFNWISSLKHTVATVLLCSFLWGVNTVQATVLTFDDLPHSTVGGDIVPNSYGGFNWTMGYVDAANFTLGKVGYFNGLVSGANVAFNIDGYPGVVSSNTDFTFIGAYFTAAWRDGLTIHAQGLKNGVQLYAQDITVNADVPNYFSFNFVGIDTVYLAPEGGVYSSLFSPSGYDTTQFAMDNFTYTGNVSAVPVPGAVWFFVSALIGLLEVARRKPALMAIKA